MPQFSKAKRLSKSLTFSAQFTSLLDFSGYRPKADKRCMKNFVKRDINVKFERDILGLLFSCREKGAKGILLMGCSLLLLAFQLKTPLPSLKPLVQSSEFSAHLKTGEIQGPTDILQLSGDSPIVPVAFEFSFDGGIQWHSTQNLPLHYYHLTQKKGGYTLQLPLHLSFFSDHMELNNPVAEYYRLRPFLVRAKGRQGEVSKTQTLTLKLHFQKS